MIVKAALVLMVNLIVYLAFGSFFCMGKKRLCPAPVTVAVGFFAYHALFAIVCLPVMFTYRPLSTLCAIWVVPCGIITAASFAVKGKYWAAWVRAFREELSKNTYFWAAVCLITALSVILTVMTYNFTLDAAYYVANVTTNVDTNMINVYDPFTGNWQDHFELRYAFATYYVNDAAICRLTGLPALVETKTVMSSAVMIMVNMLYVCICRYFFPEHRRALLMYAFMTMINFMFISIYTTSNFLMTRTYEGKSVVGNVSVVLIFVLYMMLIAGASENSTAVMLFITCLGTAAVSSTANMVIPAEVCVLFIPYAFMKKRFALLPKIFLCILPELVMMLVYVLYVKGYYAVYTFPR